VIELFMAIPIDPQKSAEEELFVSCRVIRLHRPHCSTVTLTEVIYPTAQSFIIQPRVISNAVSPVQAFVLIMPTSLIPGIISFLTLYFEAGHAMNGRAQSRSFTNLI
jgi:hypothetical protein